MESVFNMYLFFLLPPLLNIAGSQSTPNAGGQPFSFCVDLNYLRGKSGFPELLRVHLHTIGLLVKITYSLNQMSR